jgi:hypothetical protein
MDLGGGQREKNYEGFTHTSPTKSQEQGPENTPRNPPKDGSENHHKEKTETTLPRLEEPRRIINTYQGGSYKV